jgi:hypothetical protein
MLWTLACEYERLHLFLHGVSIGPNVEKLKMGKFPKTQISLWNGCFKVICKILCQREKKHQGRNDGQ